MIKVAGIIEVEVNASQWQVAAPIVEPRNDFIPVNIALSR